MADPRLRILIESETAGARAGVRGVRDDLAGVEGAARRSRESMHRQNTAMRELGGTATRAGLVLVAAAGAGAKAAIDWETAWAGVTKTVDGSAEQMGKLQGELRSMATELPASHREIAGVAEAAGQLGVATGDVSDFTRTMVDLGETTNISASDAATAIARMTNIMGTAPEDVRRLGSAVVDLGNNSATTEGEILDMALRISGAGAQIGLTESEVLGFAAALSSVGVRSQAGGTAISRAFIKVSEAVNAGGEDVEAFARVAGVSAEQFSQQFGEDAAGAMVSFIEGLGRMQESGGDVFGVLEDLGLQEQRLRDALLRSASAGDLMRQSIDRGSAAWTDNIALTEEAEKRYETTAAQLKVARDQAIEAAIGFGETLTPAIRAGASVFGEMAETMTGLPGPLQAAAGGLTAVSGGSLLALGAIGTMIPRVRMAREALRDLGTAGARADRVLGRIGRGVGLASMVLVVQQLGASLDRLDEKLQETAKSMAGLEGREIVAEFEEMTDGVRTHGSALDQLGRAFKPGSGVLSLAREAWSNLTDEQRAQAEAFQVVADTNIAGAERIIEALDAQGEETAHLREILDDTIGSQRALNEDQEHSADVIAGAAGETGGLADGLDDVADSAEGVTDTDVSEWASSLASALADATDPLRAFESVTQDVADSHREASDDIVEAARTSADASIEATAERVDAARDAVTEEVELAREALSAAKDAARDRVDVAKEEAGAVFEAAKRKADAARDAAKLEIRAARDAGELTRAEARARMADADAKRDAVIRAAKEQRDGVVAAAEGEAEAAVDAADLVVDAARDRADDVKKATDDEIEAAKDAAEQTVAAAQDQAEGMRESADDAIASIHDFIAELEAQVVAAEEWQANLVELAKRGHGGVAAELAALGPEASGLVAQAVDASEAELAKMEGLFGRRAKLASEETAQQFELGLRALSTIASTQGTLSMESLGTALDLGVTETRAVVESILGELNKLPAEKTMGIRLDLEFDQFVEQVRNFERASGMGEGSIIPIFHDGGIFRAPAGRREGLALLEDGERVLPAGQSSSGRRGGGAGTVVVNLDGREIARVVTDHQIRDGIDRGGDLFGGNA